MGAENDEAAAQKHKEWLRFIDMPQAGESRRPHAFVFSHCFACGYRVDSDVDLFCDSCQRVVCRSCGACCCGRIKYEDGQRAGVLPSWGRSERKKRLREGLSIALARARAEAAKKKEAAP